MEESLTRCPLVEEEVMNVHFGIHRFGIEECGEWIQVSRQRVEQCGGGPSSSFLCTYSVSVRNTDSYIN